MGWFVRSRIQRIQAHSALLRELEVKANRAETMMLTKQKGVVRLTEEVIRLAKKLKFEKYIIKEVEKRLRQYKLDTPKSLW